MKMGACTDGEQEQEQEQEQEPRAGKRGAAPLPSKGRHIPRLLQPLGEARHVLRDAGRVAAGRAEARAHVHGQPAGLHRRARGRAELVHVVPRQVDALGDQSVYVRADDFAVGLGAVEADVGVAQVVDQQEEDVRRAVRRCRSGSSRSGEQERRQRGQGQHLRQRLRQRLSSALLSVSAKKRRSCHASACVPCAPVAPRVRRLL